MSTRAHRQNKGNDLSRPGWPFTSLPGNGGGQRVEPDPNGTRAERRKAARKQRRKDA